MADTQTTIQSLVSLWFSLLTHPNETGIKEYAKRWGKLNYSDQGEVCYLIGLKYKEKFS